MRTLVPLCATWHALALLVSLACALAKVSVDPPVGFVNRYGTAVAIPGKLNFQDVCVSTFDDGETGASHALYYPDGIIRCQIDPPLRSAQSQPVDIEVRSSRQGAVQARLPFVSTPLVGAIEYQPAAYKADQVVVHLQSPMTLRQYTNLLPSDAAVLTIYLPDGQKLAVESKWSASTSLSRIPFPLPLPLSSGTYACTVSVLGVPITGGGQARGAAKSATSGHQDPVMQSFAHDKDALLSLTVQMPIVRLSAAVVTLDALTACGSAACNPTSELRLAVDRFPSTPAGTVLVSLVAGRSADAAAVASASQTQAVRLPQTGSGEVEVPLSQAGVEMLRVDVAFSPSGPATRRIVFCKADMALAANALEGPFFVYVASVLGGEVDASATGATVLDSSSSSHTPRFSATRPSATYRGSSQLAFEVVREGPSSEVPSVLHWTVVTVATMGAKGADGADDRAPYCTRVTRGLDGYNACSELAHGVYTWPAAASGQASAEIAVPLSWSRVPYDRTWLVGLQLSAVSNAVVEQASQRSQQLVPPPPAPPPASADAVMASAQDRLLDALMRSPNSTSSVPVAAVAEVHSTAEGACTPGSALRSGQSAPLPLAPAADELPYGLTSVAVELLMRDGTPTGRFYMPEQPLTRLHLSGDIVLPHGVSRVALVVAGVQTYEVRGCLGTGSNGTLVKMASERDSVRAHVWLQRWRLREELSVSQACAATIYVVPSSRVVGDGAAYDLKVAGSVRLWQLESPEHAAVDAVVLRSGADAVGVCGDSVLKNVTEAASKCSPHLRPELELRLSSRAAAVSLLVFPSALAPPGSVLRIGQRTFAWPPARGDARNAKDPARVEVSLVPATAALELSPLTPYIVRFSSSIRVVLDMPIALTLPDKRTTMEMSLRLTAILPPVPPASRTPEPAVSQPRAALQLASFSAPSPALASGNAPAPSQEPASADALPRRALLRASDNGTVAAEQKSFEINCTAAQDGHPEAVALGGIGNPACSSGRPGNVTYASSDAAWPDVDAAPSCDVCSIGTFSYAADTAACIHCQPGTVAPLTASPACLPCPPGSFASVYGASTCIPCPRGTYAPLPGAAVCNLCPLGFTTQNSGATTCTKPFTQLSSPGKGYVLAVQFSVLVKGIGLSELSATTGLRGANSDIFYFLISLDAAAAFKLGAGDIMVTRIEEVNPRELRARVTTNVPVDVNEHATGAELDAAVELANLSKDEGIGNLTWEHTETALPGTRATLDGEVTAVVQAPARDGPLLWPAIVFPVIAGLILLSTASLLKVRRRARSMSLTDDDPTSPRLLLAHMFMSMIVRLSALRRIVTAIPGVQRSRGSGTSASTSSNGSQWCIEVEMSGDGSLGEPAMDETARKRAPAEDSCIPAES